MDKVDGAVVGAISVIISGLIIGLISILGFIATSMLVFKKTSPMGRSFSRLIPMTLNSWLTLFLRFSMMKNWPKKLRKKDEKQLWKISAGSHRQPICRIL
jgi:hypothetical protein